MDRQFDLVIIGSGPAGMAAAIYAGRAGLSCAMIEGEAPGGKLVKTYEIANYPGIAEINGAELAMQMYEYGHEVLAVDRNEDKVNEIMPYVTDAQIGDATKESLLRSLGVSNFDVCFVAIEDNFQSSLETTSLLKELGAKLVISKASREVQAKFLLRNGADEVINTEQQIAKWAVLRYTVDHILDYNKLDDEHAMFELEVPSDWAGRNVEELQLRRKYGINILGIKTNGRINFNVAPDTVMSSGSTVLLLGEEAVVRKLFKVR